MEMREVYRDSLKEIYEKNPNEVYALEADLSSSMKTESLKNVMKDHYLNMGIMEQNMITTASGINLSGGYAFVHSFAQFLTRRALDQIFVSLAYADLSATLVGSDAGISAEHNGGTHMCFEDMAALSHIPNIEIYDVSSPLLFEKLLHEGFQKKSLRYIRTIRKAVEEIYDDVDTNQGLKVLKEGEDVAIFACGISVNEALTAAEKLKEEGINAYVIDVFRIKPLNENYLLSLLKKIKFAVVCENHSIHGGLFSALASLSVRSHPILMESISVKDQFGQVGTFDYLKKFYKLDAESIKEKVLELKNIYEKNEII